MGFGSGFLTGGLWKSAFSHGDISVAFKNNDVVSRADYETVCASGNDAANAATERGWVTYARSYQLKYLLEVMDEKGCDMSIVHQNLDFIYSEREQEIKENWDDLKLARRKGTVEPVICSHASLPIL